MQPRCCSVSRPTRSLAGTLPPSSRRRRVGCARRSSRTSRRDGSCMISQRSRHAAVREALAVLVNGQPDMAVIAQAGNGDEAVERAREARPDVIVLDISMPAMSGLEVTTFLRDALPAIRILMLTRHGEYHHVQELLRAGANGYVLKQSPSEELLQAIRVVASGGSFLDPLVAGQIT